MDSHCDYVFAGKTVQMFCGRPRHHRGEHGQWLDPGTGKPACIPNPLLPPPAFF